LSGSNGGAGIRGWSRLVVPSQILELDFHRVLCDNIRRHFEGLVFEKGLANERKVAIEVISVCSRSAQSALQAGHDPVFCTALV
jgi:hypothetical protein